ncbi:hypothetical protein I3760_05G205700 [Carya illinoinensis]|nr:hypothetical protein I3760_05G205700 [Carya illinoinensis]
MRKRSHTQSHTTQDVRGSANCLRPRELQRIFIIDESHYKMGHNTVHPQCFRSCSVTDLRGKNHIYSSNGGIPKSYVRSSGVSSARRANFPSASRSSPLSS